jgi:hypothetical protein
MLKLMCGLYRFLPNSNATSEEHNRECGGRSVYIRSSTKTPGKKTANQNDW